MAYKRDGEWHGIDVTLKDLLIGYDLMPLVGLPAMRRRLLAKGTFHRVTAQPDPKGKSFCLFNGGRPVLRFLAWGSLPETFRKAARSACGYLADELSDEAKRMANTLWLDLDGVDRKGHGAARFLRELGYTIRRVSIVEA